MTSESPRNFSIFTANIVAKVSVSPFIFTTVDMPYPNVLTYMLSTFSPPEPATSLYHWEFAVFDDALCSLVWFPLCFAFDARCAPWLKWDVSEIVFLFFKLGRLLWNRCHFCS